MSNLRRLKRRQDGQRYDVKRSVYNRMTRDNVDVLQNIEFTLANAWRQEPRIDDRTVAAVLKAVLADKIPEGEIACLLAEEITGIRRFREDVPDDTWYACLKVVLESVYNHSALQAGERNYLKFILPYVP